MATMLTDRVYEYDEVDLAVPTLSDDRMTQLARLADLQVELEQEQADAELALKQAGERLQQVRDQLLPDLMEELGLENFKTKSGLKIEVKKTITASAGGKKDPGRFAKVCAWLKEHGHGRLVKRAVGLSFGVGEESEATAFVDAINDISNRLGKPIMDEAEIHPMTLSSFVREQLEAGVDIPDYFNIHRIRQAKVEQA